MPQIYGKSKIGKGTFIAHNVVVGHPAKDEKALLLQKRFDAVVGAVIGENCVLRDFGVVYSRCKLGDNVQTGHHWMVREDTTVGDGSLVGSCVVIDDHCTIGKHVSIQTRAYIPTNTVIEDDVFIAPCVCFTNDKYMGRGDVKLEGAHVERGARIGGNVTILPGIRIGKEAVIGAGSVVTKDVPAYAVMIGNPARKLKESPKEHRKF
jgi:acetyltransferase-like isoleucine patch superfamily enzyme